MSIVFRNSFPGRLDKLYNMTSFTSYIKTIIMQASICILGTIYTAYTYCILYSTLYKSSPPPPPNKYSDTISRLFECGKNMTNSHAISHL